MHSLSVTQKYILCILSQQGALSSLKKSKTRACLIASSLWELCTANILSLNPKGEIVVQKDLPKSQSYLMPIYQVVKQTFGQNPQDLARNYVTGWSRKNRRNLNALIEALIASLLQKEMLFAENQEGFFDKTLYFSKTDSAEALLAQLNSEISSGQELSAEMAVLAVLLYESHSLKKSFSLLPDVQKLNKLLFDFNHRPVQGENQVTQIRALIALIMTVSTATPLTRKARTKIIFPLYRRKPKIRKNRSNPS